jgi:hypothetical protein
MDRPAEIKYLAVALPGVCAAHICQPCSTVHGTVDCDRVPGSAGGAVRHEAQEVKAMLTGRELAYTVAPWTGA